MTGQKHIARCTYRIKCEHVYLRALLDHEDLCALEYMSARCTAA